MTERNKEALPFSRLCFRSRWSRLYNCIAKVRRACCRTQSGSDCRIHIMSSFRDDSCTSLACYILLLYVAIVCISVCLLH